MGFKKRADAASPEAPAALYGVQILVRDRDGRKWVWGAPLYGLDTTTNVVGGHFVGSFEIARQLATKQTEYRKPGTVRIVRYELTEWEELY